MTAGRTQGEAEGVWGAGGTHNFHYLVIYIPPRTESDEVTASQLSPADDKYFSTVHVE